MKCPNCQSVNPDDAKFCTKCGQELENPMQTTGISYCRSCGSPLEPNTNFCTRCGAAISSSQIPHKTSEIRKRKKKRRPFSPTVKFACIITCFLLFDGIILFVIFKDIMLQKHAAEVKADAVNSQIRSLSDRIVSAQDELQNNNYSAASAELAELLSEYADIYEEYDKSELIVPYVDDAFASYCEAIQKQVAELKAEPPSADIYRQINDILAESVTLTAQWNTQGHSLDSSIIEQTQNEVFSIYKEKYIYLFNDLRSSDDWSFDAAWQYMQEAESIGLLERSDPDDPLTLRYAYTLAGITQKELAAGTDTQTLSYNDAVSSIYSVIETADYNPLLMIELARYLQAVDDSRADTVINACQDVYHYLAYTENIFIDPNDFFIQGKTSTNASSTIALKDFYYFNDFGEYSPSGTNGLSSEGRQYIRNTFKNTINSL